MNRTILIVDDSNAERTDLTEFLCHDYHIIEAAGEEDAISSLTNNFQRISAVVINVTAHGASGLEALRKIKENVIWQQMPVIITTELNDEEIREAAYRYGANTYVTKPYSRSLFFNVVQNAIKLRETATMANTMWRDRLTGLLNRDAFYTEATRLIKRHEPGYYIILYHALILKISRLLTISTVKKQGMKFFAI